MTNQPQLLLLDSQYPTWVQEQIAYAYSHRRYDRRSPRAVLEEALYIKQCEVRGLLHNNGDRSALVDACECRDALSDVLYAMS